MRTLHALLATLAGALPLLTAAQSTGTWVTVASPSQDVERQFAAAYRQRGFTVTESASVTQTQGGGSWTFSTASSPMFSSAPPIDSTTTVWTAVARKDGAPAADVFDAEQARCKAFLHDAADTCKVEATVAH